jgi:hypothetical protein
LGLGLIGWSGFVAVGFQLCQGAEQRVVVGLVVDIVYIHVTDDASLVNDEEGALRETFLT